MTKIVVNRAAAGTAGTSPAMTAGDGGAPRRPQLHSPVTPE